MADHLARTFAATSIRRPRRRTDQCLHRVVRSARMRSTVVGMGTALTFAKTGLALVVVMVMTQYPAGLVVVAIPVAAAFLAGRAHVKVRRERDDMVLLQRATGLAQRSLHPDEMLPLLLQHLRDMFQADIAELVLPDQKANDHLASRVGPGKPWRSSHRSTSTLRRACGRASPRAKVSCSLDRSATRCWLSTSIRWDQRCVAPVGCEDGPRHPDEITADLTTRYRGPPPARGSREACRRHDPELAADSSARGGPRARGRDEQARRLPRDDLA